MGCFASVFAALVLLQGAPRTVLSDGREDSVFGLKGVSVSGLVSIWARKAGVAHVHAHSYRHFFGTGLARREVSARAIVLLMGRKTCRPASGTLTWWPMTCAAPSIGLLSLIQRLDLQVTRRPPTSLSLTNSTSCARGMSIGKLRNGCTGRGRSSVGDCRKVRCQTQSLYTMVCGGD